jgi:Obg family GTPase CgtA-like protein
MTNWNYAQAIDRIHRILEGHGIYDKLREIGAQDGDTIVIG